MKRILFVIMVLLLTTAVVAQGAGTTPDSIFYGLDRALEQVRLAFTRNLEKRVDVNLGHAEERLAELQEMLDKGKTKYSEKLLESRQKSLDNAQEEVEKAKEEGKDVEVLAAKIEEMHAKHIIVLQGLLDKVPEQARSGIENAIEKSSRSRAVEAVTKEKQTREEEVEGVTEQPRQSEKEEGKAKEEAQVGGTGKLVMQITDKKPEVDVTKLQITVSEIRVHAAGAGGTIKEICTKENITNEVCKNETISKTVPSCVNVSRINESCENVTINNSIVLNCTNQTIIEQNCTNVTINSTVEKCQNVTDTIETCSNETETGENWFTVVNGPVTYDLMLLQDVKKLLGEKALTAGKYTQIRLTIEGAKLEIGGKEQPIKIPSGRIKLVKNFNIVDGGTTTLTLDFDAKKSVHKAGSRYIMKPTIKVIQG